MSTENRGCWSRRSSWTRRRHNSHGITRRRFVLGIVAGGVIAGLDLWRWPASVSASTSAAGPSILSGNHWNLVAHQVPVNYTGRTAYATAVNGSVPGPTLRWREGDT